MYTLSQIREVHLELSTNCNAECPLCPRNFYGMPHNDGYPLHNMTLEQISQMFSPEFVKQLNTVLINGNFGDMIMNPHSLDIVSYFREHGATEPEMLRILVTTNGGARDRNFWRRLAELDAMVFFSIDGLDDTHGLYRRSTSWHKVIDSAQTFINHGGRAIWKMIKFEHNLHQIDQAERMSQDLGFHKFELIDHGRDTGPVFDARGNLLYTIGQPKVVEFGQLFHKNLPSLDEAKLNWKQVPEQGKITCQVKHKGSMYVTATGDAYPCCYMGFYPDTYGKTNLYFKQVNLQLRQLTRENNILEHGLEHAIAWFEQIERSWNQDRFDSGRLFVCDRMCGSCTTD